MTGEIQATIPVYFIADGNEADNCDLDWSNNTVYIQIDKDYFRPDYRVEITYAYLNTSEDLAHLTCKVRNLGPEPATCPSRTTFMLNGSPAGAARVSALGAAKSIDLSFETRCVMLFGAEIKYDFLVVADQMDAIDENDEYNNTDAVTITYGHNFKEMMNFWELYPDRDSIVQTIDLGDICQVMFLDAEALMAKYGDPLNGLLRDWLDAAGSGPTFPTAYYDASTNIVVLQNYALSRNVTVVIR